MRPHIIILISLFAISCHSKTTGWQKIKFKTFSLSVPPNWRSYELKGIDSYVGGITDGSDSLSFDYGWYSAEINTEDTSNHLYAQDTINGLIAIIQIPKNQGRGDINLSIPYINEYDKFILGGSNIKTTDTVLKIFKTLIFEESDTSKNSTLTIAKFRNFSYGSGKGLFITYCASCHHLARDLAAPALKPLIKDRDAEWLYTYLNEEETTKMNKRQQIKKETVSEVSCFKSSTLTKSDIGQLSSYIKGQ